MSYHPAAAAAHTTVHDPVRHARPRGRDGAASATCSRRCATACGWAPTSTRRSGSAPVPAIMLRLPYGRRTPDMGLDVVGEFFARKGYACVVQDVRGKFSSEGEFDPGVARGRRRLRHRRVGDRAGVVRRPRRHVGRVVLRRHLLGRGDQRPPGGAVHRARRHRRRPARAVVPAGRAAAEHHRLLGDGDGRARVRRPDAASTRTTCRWPSMATAAGLEGALLRRDRGRLEDDALVAAPRARATCSTDVDVPGALVGRLVRQLPRAAAERLRDRGRAPPASRRRCTCWSGRGITRARPSTPTAPRACRCRAPPATAGTPTRRSSTTTCGARTTASGATGNVEVFTHRAQRLAARAGLAAARDGADARSTCGRAGVSPSTRRRPTRRPTRTGTTRPIRSTRPSAATAGPSARRSATAAAWTAGRTSSATCPSRSRRRWS